MFCASNFPLKLQGNAKKGGEASKQNTVGRFSVAALNSGAPVLNHNPVVGWDRDEKDFGSLGSTLCAVLALMRFTALDKEVAVVEGSGTVFLFPGI